MIYDIRHKTTFTLRGSRLGVAPRAAPRAAPARAAARARDHDEHRSRAGRGLGRARLFRQLRPATSRSRSRTSDWSSTRARASRYCRCAASSTLAASTGWEEVRARCSSASATSATQRLPVRVRFAVLGRRTTKCMTTRCSRSCRGGRSSKRRWISRTRIYREIRVSRRRFGRVDSGSERVPDAQGRMPGLRAPRDRLLAEPRACGALRERLSADASARGPREARRLRRVARVDLGVVAVGRLGGLRSHQQRDSQHRAHHGRLGAATTAT